jgi:hypothetical protein
MARARVRLLLKSLIFNDGSQERHPAIATGLTILDATDAN